MSLVAEGPLRQRAAPLAGSVVEDHGAGLGDADGGRGHDGSEVVELEGGESLVTNGVRHLPRQVRRYDGPRPVERPLGRATGPVAARDVGSWRSIGRRPGAAVVEEHHVHILRPAAGSHSAHVEV